MFKVAAAKISVCLLYCLSLLPFPVLYALAGVIKVILQYFLRYRRKVITANLLQAFPKHPPSLIGNLRSQYYTYMARLIVEVIKLRTISGKSLKARFSLTPRALTILSAATPVKLFGAVGHFNNWEWACAMLPLHINRQVQVIYKPLSNSTFNTWFTTIRSRFGTSVITMAQAGRHALSNTAAPSVTFFCFDQVPAPGSTQCPVIFMGRPTLALDGLSRLALKTSTPVYYFSITQQKPGYYLADCIPVPPASSTQQLTQFTYNMLAESLAIQPAHWLWSHNRWKRVPEIS